MRADYTELHDFLTSKGVPMSGGFSLYTKTDMKIGFFEFVSCVMVDTPRDSLDLPAHISRQEVPAGRYLSATHTGEYVYL